MPNGRKVVLIMTDSQRWDMCSCYRDTGLMTPGIDALAAGGLRFERAYTTQPVCQPARAGIFTGLYPHSCASWSNSMGISDNVLTIGQRLRDNGVRTAYVGKWHLDGSDYFGMGKCPRGWDPAYWYDMRRYLEELTPEMRVASRNEPYMNGHDFPAELTFGRRCADRAVDFLKRYGGGKEAGDGGATCNAVSGDGDDGGGKDAAISGGKDAVISGGKNNSGGFDGIANGAEAITDDTYGGSYVDDAGAIADGADAIADDAGAIADDAGDAGFFLVVSFDEPHHPYICPKPYSDMYKDFVFPKSPNVYDTLDDKPDFQRVWAGSALNEDKDALEIKRRYYFGCNSFIDGEIGRVVRAVKRYAPDALIIYTSDHGDFLESHSLSGKGPAAYDEITRIPLIFLGPGVSPGGVCKRPVSQISLAPTIMEYMGLPVPKTMEGASIKALLDGAPEINTCEDDYVFIEFGRYEVDHDSFGGFQPMRSAFDGRYKLTVNLMSGDELYDLRNDPYEMTNLIYDAGYASARGRLHDALLAHMDRTRDPFRGYYWARRPWRADASAASWGNSGMTRQREEDERYEKRQLDYLTGLEMVDAVRKK